MRNAYYEVARTYWRRSISSWVMMFCVFPPLVIPIAFLVQPDEWDRGGDFILVVAVLTYLSGLIWLHFREQVVNERRSLWPNGSTPHVVVFAVLILVLIGWPLGVLISSHHFPAVLQSLARYYGWPEALLLIWNNLAIFMGFTALLAAGVGLVVLLGWRWLIVIEICFGAWVLSDKGQQLNSILWGNQLFPTVLLYESLLIIALTVRRMIQLTEDDAAFHGRAWMNPRNLRPRMTGEASALWNRSARSRFAGLGLPRRPRAFHAGDNPWTGARRWLSAYPNSLWFSLVLAILLIALRRFVFFHEPMHTTPLLFTIFFPTAMVVLTWLGRWRFMEMELLRPIDRAAFLKRIGIAIAMDIFQMWGILTLALVIDALAPGVARVNWRLLGGSIMVSLALQAFGFAIVIYVLRFRSLAAVALGLFALGVIANAILFLINFSTQTQQMESLVVAVVIGVIGLIVARGTSRVWLMAELGG